MNAVNLIGGVVAVALLAYCVAALLFADREAAEPSSGHRDDAERTR